MKKLITICAAILITTIVFAQAPNKMSYQAVIRNSSNVLINNQAVGMKISILQNSPTGNAVYVETQTPTTNANGLASIEIGGGAVVSGNFSSINWANGPFFCKTETDITGGSSYTITATSQLLSVPYALFSGNGIIGVSTIGDSLFLGNGTSIIIPGISDANNTIAQTGDSTHTCGATNVHNPDKDYGTMTDQDGNIYKTIIIGTQEWMAENLNTSHYRNGDLILNIIGSTISQQILGAWVYYNNESQYECPYGKLYNGYTVSDSRNLCPTGWHVPTSVEWTTLIQYLGDFSKMKTTGFQYWLDPNVNATNESGFSALAGGLFSSGSSAFIGTGGYFWSSTPNANELYCFTLQAGLTLNFLKTYCTSVRCIKD